MQIKIKFTNPNTTADGIRVYRSGTFIDQGNLPAVFATIAGNVSEFIDNTAVKDTNYFYLFEVYRGTDKVFTPNIPATGTFYTGPGNQTLLGGDLAAGYYGVIQPADFTTWDAVVQMSGVTLTSKSTTVTQDWLKFVHKGKVLFTPKQPIGTVPWNTLYLLGLVYGVDGVGPRSYNVNAATNQNRIVTINGFDFRVRLMTALPPGADLTTNFPIGTYQTAQVSSYGASTATSDSLDIAPAFDFTGGEWNDLMYKIFSWTPQSQRGENWDRLDTTAAFNAATAYTGLNADCFFQELCFTNAVVSRGRQISSISYYPGGIGVIAPASAYYWRPVLELLN